MPKENWHKTLHPHLNQPGDCHRCGTRYESDPAKIDPEHCLCTHCTPLAELEEEDE